MVANSPSARVLTGIRPNRFVISLSGSCCRCGTKDGQACGTCQDSENTADCSYFNGYFEVTQDTQNPDRYLYRFPEKSPHNAQTLELRFNSNSNQPPGFIQVCVFITFGPDADDNPVRPVAWGKVSGSVSEIGVLRRRGTNTLCCWPHQITVSPAPVPDFVAPQPEWMPGDPDDLNHAPFWPSLGFDLMEDGDFAPIRYANGELQLRIKDLGSEAFGIPWGHTRIYSHRLSNSHDYGNGYNWMVHEWPRLVSFKSPLNELPPGATRKPRTGCTIALTRGTRNALWFDEAKDNTGKTTWEPRFGATHVLKHYPDEHLLKIFAPNGHVWEFYDFTSPCSREFQDLDKSEREKIAPGCLKRHIGPYGATSQQIVMTYKNCQLRTMERSAPGSGQSRTKITETFTYQWKDDQIGSVTLSRQGDGGGKRNVSRANYTYYHDPEDDHGNPGDLKTVQVEFWDNGWKSRPNTLQYYAYYKQGNSTYSQGMLKAVIGPESLHRMRTETGKDPVATGPLPAYSDLWLDYFTEKSAPAAASERVARHKPRRLRWITMDCGGRMQTYDYEFSLGGASPNQWFSQTTELRPDLSFVNVLSDVCGETMAHRLSGTGKELVHCYERHSFGRLHWIGTPASTRWPTPMENGDLRSQRPSRGKVFTFFYHSKPEFVSDVVMWQFVAHAPVDPFDDLSPEKGGNRQIRLHHFAYGHRTLSDPDIWFVKEDKNPQCDLALAPQWFSEGMAGLRSTLLTLPPVPESQHGDNTPTRSVVRFNHFGMARESVDERRVVTTTTFYDTLSLPRQVTVRSAEGELLTTNIGADEFGRVTEVVGPSHWAVTRPDSRYAEPIATASWTIYDDVNGVVISAQGFQRTRGNNELINPVHVTQLDRAGRPIREGSVVSPIKIAPQRLSWALLNFLPWCRKRERVFDTQNRLRRELVYSNIKEGKFADRIYDRYDPMDRPTVIIEPDRTLSQTSYDARGLPIRIKIGTDTLVKVVDYQYDAGQPTGNGNLTKLTQYLDDNSARVTDMTYDWRDQLVDRQVKVTNKDQQAIEVLEWDDAGRKTKIGLQTPRLNSLFETAQIPLYDPRGQMFEKSYIEQDVKGDGRQIRTTMVDLVWYDQSGNTIKIRPAGSLSYIKSRYDSLGRELTQMLAWNSEEDSPRKITAQDHVLERLDTKYDALGQPRQLTSIKFITSPGELTARNARVTHAEIFRDPLGRLIAAADYGTATPLGLGRTMPAASDLILVTRNFYNERGELERIVDPSGRTVRFIYNDAGQAIEETESLLRTTRTNYLDDGRIDSIELRDLRQGTSKRVVKYLYGRSNSHLEWGIANNSLVAKTVDADGRTTALGYNRLGEVTSMEDPNGTLHNYLYDEHGRSTDDIVKKLGVGIDGSVRAISQRYDARSRVSLITNYADPEKTKEVTLIQREFTSFDQIRDEKTIWQGRDRAISIWFANQQYFTKDIDNLNSIRPTTIQYPSGHYIHFDHSRDVESKIGRVSHIQDYGRNNKKVGDYVSYAYWGQGDVYQVRLQPDKAKHLTFNLDYPFGEKFGSLDTLDRLRFLRWVRAGKTPETAIQFDYGRDRLGLTTRQHLRTSSGAEFWQGFRYDKLDRLDFFQHTPVHRAEEETKRQQTWKLDAAGNWNEWTIRGQNPLHQTRAHTLGNRIQSITNLPKEDPWANPGYDQAGNLTRYPDPNTPVVDRGVRYDAWNRPVFLGPNLAQLTYDGLGRLIAKETVQDTRRYTYSPEWQLLEEEVAPKNDAPSYRYEYIWGVRGPDDLICREKYTPPSDTPERQYALADANGNIVAVVPESADGLDRLITYDPYGQPTGQGDFAHLFGGYYYDNQSGLYLVRNRVYHPTLGRWLQKDPLGMVDGTNLYEYCRSNPVNFVDPMGEAIAPILGWAVSIGLGAYLAKVAIDTAVSTTLEYGVASALGQDFHLGTAIGRNLAGAAIAHAIPGMGEARFAVRAAIWGGQLLARSGAEAGVETLIHGGSYWGNFGRIGVGNLGGDLAGRALGRVLQAGFKGRPTLYWHGSDEAVEAATRNGLFAHGTGSGEKYWATTIGARAWWTDILIGGNRNVDSLIPFRTSNKGGFESVYRLTTEEASHFSRAWGFKYSWNPYQWYKGLTGQYYYHPGTVSWGQRGLELSRAGVITTTGVGGGLGAAWAAYKIHEWRNN